MSKKMKHAEDEAKMKHAEEAEMKHAEEAEMKHAEEAEEKKEAEEEEEEEKKEADPEHADIEQDKELILSMIKKYMGDEEESEEVMAKAHEAYVANTEMGYEAEEAAEKAAYAMKLAKHVMGKREAEKCEAEGKKEVVPMSPKADPKKYEGKESEIKLLAKIAFLERELKKYQLTDVLDKKLKESGLGRAETDKIRSVIGELKSETQIVDTIKIFKEAFGVRSGEAAIAKGDFFISMERTAPAKKTSKINFAE